MTSRDRCIQRQYDNRNYSRARAFEPGQVVEDHTCCDWIDCHEVMTVTLIARDADHSDWWTVRDNATGVECIVHESDLQELEQQGG